MRPSNNKENEKNKIINISRLLGFFVFCVFFYERFQHSISDSVATLDQTKNAARDS